jgi:hypothetical protein
MESNDPTAKKLRDAILQLAEGLDDLSKEINGFALEANKEYESMGSINRLSAAAQSMQARIQKITNSLTKSAAT